MRAGPAGGGPALGGRLRGAHSVEVEAPRGTCVAVLLDVERYPEWYDTVDRVAVQTRDAAGRPEVLAIEIAAGPLGSVELVMRQSYDLPDSIGGEQIGGSGQIVDVRNGWTLEAVAPGRTRVGYRFSADASGLVARAALKAARGLVERDLIRRFPECLSVEAERAAGT